MATDFEVVAEYARRVLPVTEARLPDDYYYASLPLCVIDAVFSIGVRYEGVRNVLERYYQATGQPRLRTDRINLPPADAQESLSQLCERYEQIGLDDMTNLFGNRGRTSTRNGILKSEAVHRFALALRNHGVERLEDVPAGMANEELEKAIRAIPGQVSGISLAYFWMLAGSDELVKPDRMVVRFLGTALHRPVAFTECHELVSGAVRLLRSENPEITPRLLDHLVWEHQRDVPLLKSWSRDDIDRTLALLAAMEEDGFVAATWATGEHYPTYHPMIVTWMELHETSSASMNAYTVLLEDPLGTTPDPSMVVLTQTPERIATATLDQLRRYFMLCQRGERFGDGYIANEFRKGSMLAALSRLRELRKAMPRKGR